MKNQELRHRLFGRDNRNFFLLAGPCVVENRNIVLQIADQIKSIADKLDIDFVFKASYKKANRSSLDSFTGIGDERAIDVLAEVKSTYGIPVVTDVHSPEEAQRAAAVVDVLQIPAFLCRQTELLQAAAQTGCIVNIKKGQFMSPEAMAFAVEKVVQSGNDSPMITERGVTFGYHELLVDIRAIPIMQGLGYPVVLDCTHANQQPNQPSGTTNGRPQFIGTLARAGVAVGVDGLFIETHPEPAKALSDGANMLPLDELEDLLTGLVKIRAAVRDFL